MKILALLLSAYVIVILAFDLFEQNDTQKNNEMNSAEVIFTPPLQVNSELLIAEKKWQALKELRSNKQITPVIENTDSENKNKLSIGGKEYLLYGIFSAENIPFILIKDDSSSFIKLKLGDVLNKTFSLVKISSNMIVFEKNNEQVNKQKNERIEFKLFERSTYANN